MDALAFIIVIACLVLVVSWYEVNARAGSPGEKGLLAIKSPAQEKDKPAYREKKRFGALRPGLEKSEPATPAFRPARERGRAFRSKP